MAKWIQKANVKEGSLSRQLGIPENQNIPMSILNKIISTPIGGKAKVDGNMTVTRKLKQRAVFAKNVKNIGKR